MMIQVKSALQRWQVDCRNQSNSSVQLFGCRKYQTQLTNLFFMTILLSENLLLFVKTYSMIITVVYSFRLPAFFSPNLFIKFICLVIVSFELPRGFVFPVNTKEERRSETKRNKRNQPIVASLHTNFLAPPLPSSASASHPILMLSDSALLLPEAISGPNQQSFVSLLVNLKLM